MIDTSCGERLLRVSLWSATTLGGEMEPISKEELAEKYSDEEFQRKLFRLTSMSELLGSCLIAKNYRPPRDLYEEIRLTAYGDEKLQMFTRKKIPYPESRLGCFLEFSWTDLLVDVDSTNDARLQEAIGRQIKDRVIYFPFIFGRYLYDRAFEKLDLKDGLRQLSLPQTLEFLDETPQGVFQVHDMVTGPYGLLTSQQMRYFGPERHARLMHCSDVSCDEVHHVHFSTAPEAGIIKHREERLRVLKRENETPSAWGSFLSDIFTRTMKVARDDAGDGLVALIGDAFTREELGKIVAWLLDNTKGRLRKTCEPLQLRGASPDIVSPLTTAELMQLSLTVSDRDLIQGIDSLIHSGEIQIPAGEVREPVINHAAFGKFRISAEASIHGIRLFSNAMNVAPLRLRNLIERMYRLENADDREELEWQLRSEGAPSLEASLDKYLQNRSPRRVLSTLVLARKSNAITACEVLNLPDDAAERDEFISLILWKLGYPSALKGDPHDDFWRLHEEMERMVRSSPGSPLGPTVEEFRGTAANYFVELENILDDSLCFTVWALTTDHFASMKPFAYNADEERVRSHNWLQGVATRSSEDQMEFNERISLYALCRGFQCLASELLRIASERESHRRPIQDVPEWAGQQVLQRFPFAHVIPYLDLTNDARTAVADNLQGISRVLVANNVSSARNEWLHGRRNEVRFDVVRTSLHAIRSAVQIIEDAGFSRIPYAIESKSIDNYGRESLALSSVRGFKFTVSSPSPFEWLNMPNVGRGVHVMTSAIFSEPSHALRFRSEMPSSYRDMWSDYPKRKPRSQRAIQAIERLTIPES
ncbi:hypothetical protein [Streptomyces boninensis]|uniref:hypothetical protein n=1 Tax=Streptomyces boninensis TaxID=2039455 RepID=UPI003B215563